MIVNNIMVGDCFNQIKYIKDNTIDLIVTSPPYADIKSYGKKGNVFHPDNYNEWILPLFHEMYRVLKSTGSIIFNIGDKAMKKKRHTFALDLPGKVIRETDLRFYDRYFWHKKTLPNSNQKRLNNFTEFIYHFVKDETDIKFNMDDVREDYSEASKKRFKTPINLYKEINTGEKEIYRKKLVKINPKGKIPDGMFTFSTNSNTKGNKHPAPFSLELPSWFIKALTDKDDIVLDPFMGSGTTAEAAILMNRYWIGIEQNEVYISMIKERINKPAYHLFNKKYLTSFKI
jgi:site-specific DNA-methyltransferase (adenine-specific)